MAKLSIELLHRKSELVSEKIFNNIDVVNKTFNAKELRSALHDLDEIRNYMLDNKIVDKELTKTINNESFRVAKILNSTYKKRES